MSPVLFAFIDWDAFGKFNCEYLIKNYPDAEYFDWQVGNRPSLCTFFSSFFPFFFKKQNISSNERGVTT